MSDLGFVQLDDLPKADFKARLNALKARYPRVAPVAVLPEDLPAVQPKSVPKSDVPAWLL